MIQLSDNYRLTSDPNNVILEQRYTTKKDLFAWKTVGYYSDIGRALTAYIEKNMIEKITGLENLSDWIEAYRKLQENFLTEIDFKSHI